MKKLLYTFFVAAAGLMLASCKQEHIEVVYNPDATTVQTLGNFSETVLTEGEIGRHTSELQSPQ